MEEMENNLVFLVVDVEMALRRDKRKGRDVKKVIVVAVKRKYGIRVLGWATGCFR